MKTGNNARLQDCPRGTADAVDDRDCQKSRRHNPRKKLSIGFDSGDAVVGEVVFLVAGTDHIRHDIGLVHIAAVADTAFVAVVAVAFVVVAFVAVAFVAVATSSDVVAVAAVGPAFADGSLMNLGNTGHHAGLNTCYGRRRLIGQNRGHRLRRRHRHRLSCEHTMLLHHRRRSLRPHLMMGPTLS